MRYYLAPHCAIKLLEAPAVYDMLSDELYELDKDALEFMKACASSKGGESEETEFIGFCLNEGLLATVPTDKNPPPLEPSPQPSLRYLELQITRRCNLRCAHCYLGQAVDIDLRVDETLNVLREFERMQGLRLLITGGEPLMHPGFKEINAKLPEFAFRKILFTNGVMLTESALRSLNVHEIQISVDGLERSHDALRGAGTYQKAISAIKRARDNGYEVSVSTMVHADNLEDFDAMDSLFRDMGARDWTVDIPCATGNLEANSVFSLTPEESGKYLKYGFGEGLHGGAGGFACGHYLMSVTAQGKCAKCAFYEDVSVGDISEGLRACWERVRHIALSELECDCDVLEVCRGGCRYRAAQVTSALGKDLYRCHFHGKI